MKDNSLQVKKMWFQIIPNYQAFQTWFLKKDLTSEINLLRHAFNLCTTALVISQNNDSVLRDCVAFTAYIIFQHEQM